jgi:hypothetical protein
MKKYLIALLTVSSLIHSTTEFYKVLGAELIKTCKPPILEEETEEQIINKRKKLHLQREPLSDYQMHAIFSDLLQKHFPLEESSIFNTKVWNDLELLIGSHDANVSIFKQIKRTHGMPGDFYLAGLITRPTTSIKLLQKNQNIIQMLRDLKSQQNNDTKALESALTTISKGTGSILSFFEPETEFNQKMINAYYFSNKNPISRALQGYNTNPTALECSQVLHRIKNVGKVLALPAAALRVVYKNVPGTRNMAYSERIADYEKKNSEDKTLEKFTTKEEELCKLKNEKRQDLLDNKITYDVFQKAESEIDLARINLTDERNAYIQQQYQKEGRDIVTESRNEGLKNALKFLSPIPSERNFRKEIDTLRKEGSDKINELDKDLREKRNALYAENGALTNKVISELGYQESSDQRDKIDKELAEKLDKLREDAPAIQKALRESYENQISKLTREGTFAAPFATAYIHGLKKILSSDYTIREKQEFLGQSIVIGMATGFQTYMTYSAYSDEKENNTITNYLHAQLLEVAKVVRALQSLSTLLKKYPELDNALVYSKDLHALFDDKDSRYSQKMHQLIDLLLTNTFKGDPSYFCHKGRVLAAYKLMTEVKNEFAIALHATGEVDAFYSCAQLYEEYANTSTPYSFAEYLDGQKTPSMDMQEMWNPFVNIKKESAHKVVTNSIKLGPDMRKNALISGPNAGGKSTFMKGLNITVILGQTLGIVPAEKLSFTPFAKIITYMNITDDTASGKSLFMSEVERAQELLDTVEDLTKKEFSLCIMDEMFSGTSPREGEAASYAVAEEIGSIKNSILLLASHFDRLKKLETETPLFTNYQVRVLRYDNGTFTYPFKVEHGAANQNVAIDILKQKGINSRILDKAQQILAEHAE